MIQELKFALNAIIHVLLVLELVQLIVPLARIHHYTLELFTLVD